MTCINYTCLSYHLPMTTARVRSTTGGCVFTGVYLFRGGGTSFPGSFPGLWSQVLPGRTPQSQVLSQVSGPRSFPGGGGGYPSPGRGGGTLVLSLGGTPVWPEGDMPLAVTQENFPVVNKFINVNMPWTRSHCHLNPKSLHYNLKKSIQASVEVLPNITVL